MLAPAAVTGPKSRSHASRADMSRFLSSDASYPPGTRIPTVSTSSGEYPGSTFVRLTRLRPSSMATTSSDTANPDCATTRTSRSRCAPERASSDVSACARNRGNPARVLRSAGSSPHDRTATKTSASAGSNVPASMPTRPAAGKCSPAVDFTTTSNVHPRPMPRTPPRIDSIRCSATS